MLQPIADPVHHPHQRACRPATPSQRLSTTPFARAAFRGIQRLLHFAISRGGIAVPGLLLAHRAMAKPAGAAITRRRSCPGTEPRRILSQLLLRLTPSALRGCEDVATLVWARALQRCMATCNACGRCSLRYRYAPSTFSVDQRLVKTNVLLAPGGCLCFTTQQRHAEVGMS